MLVPNTKTAENLSIASKTDVVGTGVITLTFDEAKESIKLINRSDGEMTLTAVGTPYTVEARTEKFIEGVSVSSVTLVGDANSLMFTIEAISGLPLALDVEDNSTQLENIANKQELHVVEFGRFNYGNKQASTVVGETTQHLYRSHAYVTGLKLVYSNNNIVSLRDAEAENDITLAVSFENENGDLIPFRFNGAKTITIEPGQTITSDELGVSLKPDEDFFLRCFTSVPVDGNTFPYNYNANKYAVGNVTEGGALLTSTKNGFSPIMIIGKTSQNVVLGIGDSNMSGTGDDNLTDDGRTLLQRGFFTRGMLQKYAFLNIAKGSQSAKEFVDDTFVSIRNILLSYTNKAFIMLGTNDIYTSSTAEDIIGYLQELYNKLSSLGIDVYACTMPPVSTSTDGWTTIENQTRGSNMDKRDAVNDWIRTNAQNVFKVIDIADALEPSRNAGIWSPNLTGDGTHMNEDGHILAGEQLIL